MTSEKVLNCYHEYQQLVGWTRIYHLIFVMKMMCAHECSSRGAFGVNAFFRWLYPMTHNAPSHHILFFWSYPIYKSFSLWKQHKAIFRMEIILLLLGTKWGNSEQHECFSLVFIHHPIQLFPSNHPINTRLFSKGDGSWRIRHTFLLAYLIYI